MNIANQLQWIDFLIMLIYFGFVLGIGFILKRHMRTSSQFLSAGRAIPAWVAGLAFLSANLGAQEVIGMAASGAKYGIATAHFYWVGAIPAMVFVGIFMMPFYYGSKARSVPDYLSLRFDEKTRAFNAITFACMTIMSSGISMYAMALLIQSLHIFDTAFRVMQLPESWVFHVSIVLSAVIVLAYIFLGGLTSAIYNEVLQFFLIVAGFAPLVFLGLKNVGGWSGIKANVPPAFVHAWAGMGSPHDNPLGVGWFSLIMGLGFVLSFGYWCTDFLVVQRAMAADSMNSARCTPLIASVPKMLFPFLVILPGLIALAITRPITSESAPKSALAPRSEQYAGGFMGRVPVTSGGAGSAPITEQYSSTVEPLIPVKTTPSGQVVIDKNGNLELDYNAIIPQMLLHFFPSGILGIGLTALLASFMSGMAGNVTAFNTVWTYDIYQSYIRKGQSDEHYLHMARFATVFGVLFSIGTAYFAAAFNNIMDVLQLVFAFVNAPLFATFLLGMFWKRATGHGAFFGLLSGTLAAAIHQGLTLPANSSPGIKGGWIGVVNVYPSEMAQNFWTAIFAWTTCFIVTIIISLATKPRAESELRGLVYALTEKERGHSGPWYTRPVPLGIIVLALTLLLNLVFF
ncbi:MAG: sodium:solute symporter family protein [Verrucomicrobia bacterium]|nr:sodium:solute symporter family protein [Verrucomicrobiota bacterium]